MEVGPVRIIGGVRPQNFDVGYRPDGVRFAFDSKTLNDRSSIGKNWQNMINDIATEATTVHSRFPYAVVGFMVIYPKPAVTAAHLAATIGTLERLGGRTLVDEPEHRAEAMALVIWDPDERHHQTPTYRRQVRRSASKRSPVTSRAPTSRATKDFRHTTAELSVVRRSSFNLGVAAFVAPAVPTPEKLRGGYYTPDPVARFLAEWVAAAGQICLSRVAETGRSSDSSWPTVPVVASQESN